MNRLFKRLICITSAVFLCSITLLAAAEITINAGEDFAEYRLGGDTAKAAAAVGISEDEFTSYCDENSIIYFAADKGNKRQIRVTSRETAFANSIGNLSLLPDERITALMPQITGTQAVAGEIILKQGQKFVRVNAKSGDSGGDYGIIQYITVAEKREYVLSFYTSSGEENGYAETVFDSFDSESFIESDGDSKSATGIKYVIIAAAVILTAAIIFIIITLVRDIRADER